MPDYKTITLNNGVQMPAIGYGASIIPKGDGKIRSSELATKQWHMYKKLSEEYSTLLYDISPSYGLCEYVLGNAIENTCKRQRMFIALKISNMEQRSNDVKAAFEKHLEMLHTDYVDLLMLHWPHPGTYIDSYLAMEEIYASGKARAIGVSNFHQHHLESLMEKATIVPAVNQIEVHPLFTQEPLRQFCENMGTKVIAYTPLGRMHDVLIKNKTLRAIAAQRKKTVPQIILRWDLDSGMGTIPRTLNFDHFKDVMDILDFELTSEEVKAIDAVNENVRLRFNPDTVDYNLV